VRNEDHAVAPTLLNISDCKPIACLNHEYGQDILDPIA
jgi:hypothetical protein